MREFSVQTIQPLGVVMVKSLPVPSTAPRINMRNDLLR